MPEEYSGTKFKTKLVQGKRDLNKASELIKWCREFYKMGIASPSGKVAGNISTRTKKGFLITPSGQNFSKLKAEQLVEVIEVNKKTHTIKAIGKLKPSSEAFLHAGIYKARPEVNAILHGHNSTITKNPEKFGLVETEKEQPYGTPALRDEVLKVLNENNLLQMKNHGFIALGKTLKEAGERAHKLYRKALEFKG